MGKSELGRAASRPAGVEAQAGQDLSRTARVWLQALWRVLNEPHGVKPEEPPPALPRAEEPEPSFIDAVRRRFEWALEGAGARIGRAPLESTLGELFAVEPDANRCVRALHETGFLDERCASFYATRFDRKREDGIVQRVLIGRLANDLRWRRSSAQAAQ